VGFGSLFCFVEEFVTLPQVLNASKKSYKARLVSLGDKLYNLRDLTRTTPEGWTESRVQEYFEWSAQVVRGMLGTNAALESNIETVLNTRGVSLYSKPS